ncbi:hypothetical protein BGZ76_001563 [Entomortierella beljakovae]|nr:hypothetical protein BGZ76_001563 [Entomortierella beljakovae]
MSRRSSRIATAIVPANVSAATAVVSAKARSSKNPRVDKENEEFHQKSTSKKIKTEGKAHSEFVDDGKTRCTWAANSRYPLLQQYHDTEWCIAGGFNRTNRYLFEMIILEGAQAGLSWSTVLHKRGAYREAYDNFDYSVIASTYTSPASNERLLTTDIIKNKLKVEASMVNAKAFRDLLNELYPDQAQPEDENGFWQFLQAYKKQDDPGTESPSSSMNKSSNNEESHVYLTKNEASDRLSSDLKKRGFKFVGTTIMYSYLQAVGIELEGTHHTKDCFVSPNNK